MKEQPRAGGKHRQRPVAARGGGQWLELREREREGGRQGLAGHGRTLSSRYAEAEVLQGQQGTD